jgi:hypothetical protein
MAHVFLPSGRGLRLRLYPKPKSLKRAPASSKDDKAGSAKPVTQSLALFNAPVEDDSQDTAQERLAAKITSLALLNRTNAMILERAPDLGLRDWWLVAGCLFQTVWNLKSGRSPDRGIRDYDLFYFSEDLSAEAEEDVAAAAARLFGDINANIKVSNQARVHLWYPEKIGMPYPALTTAAEGIARFPCSPQAVGLKRTGAEFLDVFAPFGMGDVWDMMVRPNRSMPLVALYNEKCARWQAEWPQLQVYGWDGAGKPKLRVVHSQPG